MNFFCHSLVRQLYSLFIGIFPYTVYIVDIIYISELDYYY